MRKRYVHKGNLIDEVHKYPMLYDMSNSEYHLNHRKEDVWRNIGYQIGCDGYIIQFHRL
jgi:hypothetical protein